MSNFAEEARAIMTPTEFKQIRKDAGYTQRQLSDLIGIDSRTIRRYEAGMAINKPVVILMELIEQGIYPIDHKRKVG